MPNWVFNHLTIDGSKEDIAKVKAQVGAIVKTKYKGADEVDEAMCLAAGADDYIRKPVSPRILSLRVGNQLRRRGIGDGKEITLLKAGGLTLDLMSHELRVGDAIVPLTRTEFDFIELLIDELTNSIHNKLIEIFIDAL